MNNKAEELKEESRPLDINESISQKIAELQKLISQLKDYGCVVLYCYNNDQGDDNGFVKGMIDGKGVMIKRALEKLAMNDENFQDILAYAYIDTMPSKVASRVAKLMHLIYT